jgi:hypothetical protein
VVTRASFNYQAILDALARGERRCGDLGLRIDRRGTWHYRGSPIGRIELVRLFASVLHRTPDGAHWLVTPVEQGRLEVEDAAFVAVEVAAEGDGAGRMLRFRTNLDVWVEAGPDHPIRLRPAPEGGEVPYLDVGRGLEARILPSVLYELVDLGGPAPDGRSFGVTSRGCFFRLGPWPLEDERAA